VQFINPMWSQPSSEKEFLGLLQKLVDAKKLSPELQAGWIDFYQNYRKAVESSGVAGAEKVATKVQATIADTVFNQVSRLRYMGVTLCVFKGLGCSWACLLAGMGVGHESTKCNPLLLCCNCITAVELWLFPLSATIVLSVCINVCGAQS
jgi:hypothetical protein